MKFVAALGFSFLLAGCNATATKVVSSSPRTVGVQSFKGLGEAQKAADLECAKHNRYARWVSGDLNYVFDCVQ